MKALKEYGPIGAAIALVSGIAAYLLPIPHAYSQVYSFVFGPLGAFIGYAVAQGLVERAKTWKFWQVLALAFFSLLFAVLAGFGYFHLYWLEPSPALGARILHALLYA
ncbi:MAG: hypothetical protein GY844_01765, partial [Bradyrhizobium sp.]|nr:hypothetical protein [Bradyrhizobium sp.]